MDGYYSENKYASIDSGEAESIGFVIPAGEVVGVSRFIGNGFSSSVYVILAFDWGGVNEKIFCSTNGNVDLSFDIRDPKNQVVGDGVAKLQLILINDSLVDSPIFGGSYQAGRVD